MSMMIQNVKTGFDSLPNEIVVKILYQVSGSDLGRIASVCRKWRTLVENESGRENIRSRVLLALIGTLPEDELEGHCRLSELKRRLLRKDFAPMSEEPSGFWDLFSQRKTSIFDEADDSLCLPFKQIFRLQQITTCHRESFVERGMLLKIKKIARNCFDRRFHWSRFTLSLHGFTFQPIYHNLLTSKVRLGPLEIGFPRFDVGGDLTEEMLPANRAVLCALPSTASLSVDLESTAKKGVNRSTWLFLDRFLRNRSSSIINLSLGNIIPLESPWGEDFDKCIDFFAPMKNLSWLSLNLNPPINDHHAGALCRLVKKHGNTLTLTLYNCMLSCDAALLLAKEISASRSQWQTELIITSPLLSGSDLERLNEEAAKIKQKKHEFLFKNRLF